MFDIGLFELLVVGLVALLVLGPDKLPGAARQAGQLLRRARQIWYGFRSEIEREFAAEEFKRSIRDTRQALEQHVRSARDGADALREDVQAAIPKLTAESDDPVIDSGDAMPAGLGVDPTASASVPEHRSTDDKEPGP